MKRIILIVVCIVTIGTLIGGGIYWNQKIDATSQKAKQSLDQSPTNSTNKAQEDSTSSNANEDKKKTAAAIEKEYTALFNELEAQETSKLDQLLVEAKAEYISGKGTKQELTTKYQAVLKQLEANADKSFNIIYQELQYELERNGHNPKEAQQFQKTYNSEKESRAERLVNEINEF